MTSSKAAGMARLVARRRSEGKCAQCELDAPDGYYCAFHVEARIARRHGLTVEFYRKDNGCRKCYRGMLCHNCNVWLVSSLDGPNAPAAIKYVLSRSLPGHTLAGGDECGKGLPA